MLRFIKLLLLLPRRLHPVSHVVAGNNRFRQQTPVMAAGNVLQANCFQLWYRLKASPAGWRVQITSRPVRIILVPRHNSGLLQVCKKIWSAKILLAYSNNRLAAITKAGFNTGPSWSPFVILHSPKVRKEWFADRLIRCCCIHKSGLSCLAGSINWNNSSL